MVVLVLMGAAVPTFTPLLPLSRADHSNAHVHQQDATNTMAAARMRISALFAIFAHFLEIF